MQSLMTQLQPPESSCCIAEFISGDDELAVCSELENEQWKEQFFNSLAPSTGSANAGSESEDEELDLEPPAPKLKNLGEAICNLEDVRQFLDSKGYAREATTIASAVDMVTALHCRARQCTQSTLDGFITSERPCCAAMAT